MKLLESIRIAMRALAANKLRSVLTMLGIIIGVAAVIALMSIGRGVEKYVTDQFEGLGSNLLFIAPGQLEAGPPSPLGSNIEPLTLSDMVALSDGSYLPDVAGVAAEYVGNATAEREGNEARVNVSGVTASYPRIRSWTPTVGAFFSEQDVEERARVALLGLNVYNELFDADE